MKDMPTFVVTNGDQMQSNYEKLKTDQEFIWSVPNSAANKLTPGVEWLVINLKKKEIFLALVTSYVTSNVGGSTNKTSIGAIEIEGDYINRTFVRSSITEQLTLSDKFLIPHLGAGKGSVLFNLGQQGKTRVIAVRNAIKEEVKEDSKIFKYLEEEAEDLDDCIAYKRGNQWGFLFYTLRKDGPPTFRFEAVNNKSLNQTDEGYKDFVYFIFSHGYPKAIKVGRSDNPSKRLKGLDGANPASISLLLVLPDGRKEKMYHQKFNNYLIYGKFEWFWDDPEIRKFIKDETLRLEKIKMMYSKCTT